jgi:hypothetical protein
MSPIWRSVLGVVSGLVVHGVVVTAVQAVGHAVYGALPPDIFKLTWAERAELINGLPVGSLVFVVAAWSAGTLVGGLVAAWIAGRAPLIHAGIIGGLDLLCVGIMMTMLPHPAWMAASGPVCVILATLLAARLAGPLQASGPAGPGGEVATAA